MEQLLYSLSLRYLPFLEHLLNDLINDNSENQNNRKIDTNNKKDVKILKLISNSGSSKIDLNLLKLNKMHVLLQKLRNLGPKSTVGKKGKSKGTAGTGGGEEEGESVGEKEVHNFFICTRSPCSCALFLYLFSNSLTHSLTHPLTHLLTHSLTHLLTYSLTHSPPHSLTLLLTYSLTHSLTLSPVGRAGHIVHSQLIEESYRGRVTTMFPTHTQLTIFSRKFD